ncbi:putative OTU domain, papain-like cysteine peptidase superfamily [Helianthus annuus]|uniref:Ubiquitin thioesterase OTU n=1 Tax=Helianthus annuus TaxID=4232 RepID=A0A251UY39_HELAN|nr:uncharacterized protein LOC110936407 [Helianthus annuus]KAF5810486.1 putative OTU domain, papain-like cysteine peptidase superfamily [Helianthus annuus]KAJ0581294.1 putative OTU domain, papain-like cysteine peptidase superfamily [Helianthus annuus]KAJ0589221.1 putative OTU domain, papain-like cysteine peptidase superfamily [Helianthus annuus]KAJ0597240.1 putative OTU domain, papain-like cysteine peptidase superfamily [Helianthus annuus]KAJ0757919.1 putative OTU domain, papain-like cysteine 
MLTTVDFSNQTDHTTVTHHNNTHTHSFSLTINTSLSLAAIFTPVMFGDVLCDRPKPWFLCPSLFTCHYSSVAHRLHGSDCGFPIKLLGPANGFCDMILRDGHDYCSSPVGEGSWNVAWDMRPARWLHRPHTAWLLFGICAYLAPPPVDFTDAVLKSVDINDERVDGSVLEDSANYRVTGVPADGRCLFRAIAHMVCLRKGEDAPDENRQKELADELRVQVVDELVRRQKEIEWFIEGDFDAYVKRIEKPFVWGGEPELLMASHVLKTTISVYTFERGSNNLSKIATYGEEYEQDEISSIKVLFHGYGHYDILEDKF